MCKSLQLLAVSAVLALFAMPAAAYDKGDWVVRVGAGFVQPDNPVLSEASEIGVGLDVDDGTSLVATGTYFFNSNWAFEILLAAPFSHDIKLSAVDQSVKIGETKHLPPTFSFQYHFLPDGTFRPYAGLGLNYTVFFDEKLDQTILDGFDLKIDGSFGLAAQLGADIKLSDKWLLNVDLRYIQIEPDATLSGGGSSDTSKIDINPMVYSISVGYMF